MAIGRQGRAETGGVACRQHLGEERERLVGARSIAHQFFVGPVVIMVVVAVMPLVDGHDFRQILRQAQPLFGVGGPTEIDAFEGEKSGEVPERWPLEETLVILNIGNPFGESRLRRRDWYPTRRAPSQKTLQVRPARNLMRLRSKR